MSSRPMLFLVIDAVPFDVVHELWRAGHAPGFGEPRPMISVFPSLTNVAVPALVRSVFGQRPPGYEPRYYHPPSGTVRGGLSDPASEAALEPYRSRPRGSLGHLAVYSLPGALAYGGVRWITRRFQQEGGPWLGYLAATDGVGHFQGRDALVSAVRDIFGQVVHAADAYEAEHGERPGLVLASDHGLWFGDLAHLDARVLEDLLGHAGFVAGRVAHDGVLLVPMGDVGAGVVWCEPERAVEVAEIVAHAPGVELACGVSGDGCVVFGHAGESRARVAWRDDRYRYEAEAGDPLGYGHVSEMLGEWMTEAALVRATVDHRYPCAPQRLRGGFESDVDFPAPVLFSMADGWTYGPSLTHAAAVLRGGQVGTHGALSRAQSLGFAIATTPWEQPAALRPWDVFAPWADVLAQRRGY